MHLYQAELKARKKKTVESMVDLGRDVAKLVRLTYLTTDATIREVIGIYFFLEALSGPAAEMKLHIIKGRPHTSREAVVAVAHATEVDVIEAESRKTSLTRGEVSMVEPADEELQQEVKRLKEDLMQTRKELKEVQWDWKPKSNGRKPMEKVTC